MGCRSALASIRWLISEGVRTIEAESPLAIDTARYVFIVTANRLPISHLKVPI